MNNVKKRSLLLLLVLGFSFVCGAAHESTLSLTRSKNTKKDPKISIMQQIKKKACAVKDELIGNGRKILATLGVLVVIGWLMRGERSDAASEGAQILPVDDRGDEDPDGQRVEEELVDMGQERPQEDEGGDGQGVEDGELVDMGLEQQGDDQREELARMRLDIAAEFRGRISRGIEEFEERTLQRGLPPMIGDIRTRLENVGRGELDALLDQVARGEVSREFVSVQLGRHIAAEIRAANQEVEQAARAREARDQQARRERLEYIKECERERKEQLAGEEENKAREQREQERQESEEKVRREEGDDEIKVVVEDCSIEAYQGLLSEFSENDRVLVVEHWRSEVDNFAYRGGAGLENELMDLCEQIEKQEITFEKYAQGIIRFMVNCKFPTKRPTEEEMANLRREQVARGMQAILKAREMAPVVIEDMIAIERRAEDEKVREERRRQAEAKRRAALRAQKREQKKEQERARREAEAKQRLQREQELRVEVEDGGQERQPITKQQRWQAQLLFERSFIPVFAEISAGGKKERIAVLNGALKEGADIHFVMLRGGLGEEQEYCSWLQFAIKKGNQAMIQFLLDLGMDPDSFNRKGVSDKNSYWQENTPLMGAIDKGDFAMVQFLINKGASCHRFYGALNKALQCYCSNRKFKDIYEYVREQTGKIEGVDVALGVVAADDGEGDAKRAVEEGGDLEDDYKTILLKWLINMNSQGEQQVQVNWWRRILFDYYHRNKESVDGYDAASKKESFSVRVIGVCFGNLNSVVQKGRGYIDLAIEYGIPIRSLQLLGD